MTPLRIAITVDPYLPVPPRLYGGIERVVDIVVRGLVSRGHQITLFAHPESTTAGALVPYGCPPHVGWWPRIVELCQVGIKLWRLRRNFDVVLSWGRLAALIPILPVRQLPKIQRYCRDSVPWASVKRAVGLAGPSICFAGASASVYDEISSQDGRAGSWVTIYDAIELTKFNFVPEVPSDAPLCFLGRLEPIKGVHHAIAIAKASGRKVIIAGNRVETGASAGYFDSQLAPHIDGDRVRYIGAVDDAQKNALLGSCAALFMPIEWKEAFGIVMAEALACGTPVIGFARGSVPEVIRDGVTGFVCGSVEQAVEAVGKLGSVSRAEARADCEARFSANAVVDAYEQLCYNMQLRSAGDVRSLSGPAPVLEVIEK